MRRERRKRDNHQTNPNTIMYVSGGILAAAVISFVIAFVVYANRLNSNSSGILDVQQLSGNYDNAVGNTASASSKIGKTVEEAANEAENDLLAEENTVADNTTIGVSETEDDNQTTAGLEDTDRPSKTKTTSVSTTTKSKENSTKTEQKGKQKDPTFINPIEKGEVKKEFAKENLVYSDTLKEWVTHLGVDIKADKATVVKAACEGTVKDIKNDPRYGLTVIIEHANGYKTVYANLLTTEFVSEGEKVKQGQTIGTVGDTGVYDIVDEPHLHFEILKDNENVNPAEYIKF